MVADTMMGASLAVASWTRRLAMFRTLPPSTTNKSPDKNEGALSLTAAASVNVNAKFEGDGATRRKAVLGFFVALEIIGLAIARAVEVE